MVGKGAPDRKFPRISVSEGLRVLGDEVGNLVHDGIRKAACGTQ
jgi:hypothetical protein